MSELTENEKIKLAKSLVKKGMPVSQLQNMNIDVQTFPIDAQRKIYALASRNKLSTSIAQELNTGKGKGKNKTEKER